VWLAAIDVEAAPASVAARPVDLIDKTLHLAQ